MVKVTKTRARTSHTNRHRQTLTHTHNQFIIKCKIRKKVVSVSQSLAILLLSVPMRFKFTWDGIRQEFAIWWQICYKCDGPKVAFSDSVFNFFFFRLFHSWQNFISNSIHHSSENNNTYNCHSIWNWKNNNKNIHTVSDATFKFFFPL